MPVPRETPSSSAFGRDVLQTTVFDADSRTLVDAHLNTPMHELYQKQPLRASVLLSSMQRHDTGSVPEEEQNAQI